MEASFKIKEATKAKRRDVEKAIDIYIHTVDHGSETNTNEIYDYISNKYDENRIMFFYVLYHNGDVEGYAEYAYLPKNSTLVLDYICTESRNHTYFYNFYHLILESITESLKNQSKHIKYIITELSLRKEGSMLIDLDSNYFRKLLSIEEFTLLKLPYYQPNLNEIFSNEVLEFNLAIKTLNGNNTTNLIINREFYLSMVKEIYDEHYKAWYYHNHDEVKVNNYIDNLYKEIQNTLPNKDIFQRINVVNCTLFEEGICKQISPENITITKLKKQKRKMIKKMGSWLVFCIATLLFSTLQLIPNFPIILTNFATILLSFLTIITGFMAIIQYFKS